MTTHQVHISAAARLHFGLLRFEQTEGRSFGGLGVMVDTPRTVLQLAPAASWPTVSGESLRVQQAARRALEAWGQASGLAALQVEVVASLPAHRGLGSGTQLALAAAAGVRALVGLPPASAAELARVAGRGRRSGVGAHGFHGGGLVWEVGWLPGESTGRLAERVALPSTWRVVMAIPAHETGLSGVAERDAFAQLPAPPTELTDRLIQLAEEVIVPAARAGDFATFSAGVSEYGREAGSMFAPVQGGSYASPEIARRVAALREAGCCGVGQSSWGPTVFGLCANAADATFLRIKMGAEPAFAECELTIAGIDNQGAVVTRG
ncbi:MAG: hypothetical protein KF847_17895 [Pirellulales bacterium]|nr:hypothetical protein [Pirellulales bacterium]